MIFVHLFIFFKLDLLMVFKIILKCDYNKKNTQHTFLIIITASVSSLGFIVVVGGHGGRVVTLSPSTYEAGVRSPARPQVGKLVVACHWSAFYSTEL